MATPESLPETYTDQQEIEPWRQRIFDAMHDRYAQMTGPENHEAGFVQVIIVKKLAKMAMAPAVKIAGRKGAAAALSLGVTFAGAAATAEFIRAHQIHGGADLEKAQTSSESKALVFNKKKDIEVADLYFKEKFTAKNIPYEIEWKPLLVDVIPDYKESKELNGVGKTEYKLPFTAITPKYDEETGKTDYTIDKSKLQLASSWVESPVIQDFVMDGKTRKYSANGFKSNMVKNISETFTHFSIDNFKNAVNDIDMLAERAIEEKALEVSSQSCSTQLDSHLQEAAKEAIIANVESLGQKGSSVGTVTFTEGKWTLTEESIPEVVQQAVDKTYKHNRNIVVNKDFTVDSVKCDINENELQTN
jgi:hypothetical protein